MLHIRINTSTDFTGEECGTVYSTHASLNDFCLKRGPQKLFSHHLYKQKVNKSCIAEVYVHPPNIMPYHYISIIFNSVAFFMFFHTAAKMMKPTTLLTVVMTEKFTT